MGLTDRAREIPLEQVLKMHSAIRNRHDRKKWKTDRGTISIQGQKFYNFHTGTGGGGAIDLVIHLLQRDFKYALNWLVRNFRLKDDSNRSALTKKNPSLRLPQRCTLNEPIVIRYLTGERKLPERIVRNLMNENRFYADNRQNAVFVLLGKEKNIVGAELCGTTSKSWKGVAPGTDKSRGFFYAGSPLAKSCIITESAIDAVSCHILNSENLCISSAGVCSNPRWIDALITRGYEISCGFDRDSAGDIMAEKLIREYPRVQRIKPASKDWNQDLKNQYLH